MNIDLFDVLLISNVNENPKKPFASLNDQIDKIVNSGFVNEKLTDILKKVIPLYQIGTKVDLSVCYKDDILISYPIADKLNIKFIKM